MTKEEIFATSIFEVPGISPRALNQHINRFERFREDRTGYWRDVIRTSEREPYRSNPELTVGAIVREHPLPAFLEDFPGRKEIVQFVVSHGLTRVDWRVIPYDEARVLEQLRHMGLEAVRKLPISVFGFITSASYWVMEVCGTLDVFESTIAQFLDCDVSRKLSLPSLGQLRLKVLLRDLGFEAPVLLTGKERLLLDLVNNDGLSKEEAARFIEVGIRRGFIPINRLS